VNTVSLIGRLVEKPTLHTGETGAEESRLRLAVPRRGHAGELEPGVLYLEALTIGPQARACAARLGAGALIGLSGRLEVDRRRSSSDDWEESHSVLIDQLDLLDEGGR
jgi:single-stranded DNA-binding protein